MSSENEGGLLVLILDTNLLLAASASTKQENGDASFIRPDLLLSQVMIFINAFLLLNEKNELAVYGATACSCELLYSSQAATEDVRQHGTPNSTLQSKLLQLLEDLDKAGGAAHEGVVLSGALSRALCFIHRYKRERQLPRSKTKPRILIMQASGDVPTQYIAVMNSIFSAQRAEVVLDALVMSAMDSPLLQQATHITGGIYERIPSSQEPLQFLLTLYAADTHTRSMLRVHKSVGVDFRASCFCHKKTIDLGFVCSICLSIFCKPMPECSTCGTSFSTRRAASMSKSASAGISAAP